MAGVPTLVLEAMQAAGWDVPALFRLECPNRASTREFVVATGIPASQVDAAVSALWSHRQRITLALEHNIRRIASASALEVQWRGAVVRRAHAESAHSASLRSVRSAVVHRAMDVRPPEGKKPVGGVLGRHLRRPEPADASNARATAESAIRQKFVAELGRFITEGGLPLSSYAAGSADPERVLARAGAGKRAGTLRLRPGAWRKARRWLLQERGVPFPSDVGMALEYAEVLADEPCPPSRLRAFASALALLESAGGVAPDAAITVQPAFKTALDEICLTLSDRPGVDGRLKRAAPRSFVIVLVALELTVVNPGFPLFLRLWAWWRRLKSAATLRHDDHRGWSPQSTVLSKRGLATLLTRTKTSGAGKRTEVLPVFASSAAFVAESSWLVVGWDLWQKSANFPRDYLLAMPSSDLGSVTKHEVRYSDALAFSRALSRRLLLPRWDSPSGLWALSDEPLFLFDDAVRFWSEHSERADAPSSAPLLGFNKEWCDSLGNWGGDGSEGYCRTRRLRAEIMQAKIADAIRHGRNGPDFLDEDELAGQFRSWLSGRGHDDTKIVEQLDRLTYFNTSESPSKIPRLSLAGAVDFEGTGETPGEDDPTPLITSVLPSVARGSRDVHEGSEVPADYVGFVLAVRRRCTRLHRVGPGGCWRRPGRDYYQFTLCGEVLPAAEAYDDFCHQCWPDGSTPGDVSSSSVSDSSSSSSSSAV